MENEKNVFTELNAVNVNEHVEKKNTGKTTLSYLSWSWALQEVMKRYPDTTWEVKLFDGKPYIYDEKTGYMVFTSVTIQGVTREMWLPVMDGRNDAMLDHPVSHTNSYGKAWTTEAATMFDVNKTIMRCLTKNLSVFGLGLYIYAGEDLPEEEKAIKSQPIQLSPEAQREKDKAVKELSDRIQKLSFLLPQDRIQKVKDETKVGNISYLTTVANWLESESAKLQKTETA